MTNVSSWVAICYGALDVRAHDFAAGNYDLIVTPTEPGDPLMLHGEGAALWQRLVAGPLPDLELTDVERDIVRDMAQMGIASRDEDHPARIHGVSEPWLTSPLHELVYALLAHVAVEIGVRLFFIKGPTLHAQGLRERIHSGDVDCWVEPGAERRFASAMAAWGWTPAYSAFTGTRVLHSLTLRASDWGCAVDVHSWFPGMTVTPAEAFEMAYDAAELREFAAYAARTPPTDLHAVISALNEVRPLRGAVASPSSITSAAATLSIVGESALRRVEEFGAEYALSAPLAEAFPGREVDYSTRPVPLDWRWRLQRTPTRVYWEALRIVPPRERLRVIFRVVWPSAESLRSGPMSAGVGRKTTSSLRLKRLAVGFQQIRKRSIR